MKKVLILLKYSASSITSFFVDQIFFRLFLILLSPISGFAITIATYLARLISSIMNYLFNKNYVFKDKSSGKKTLLKYYLLVIINAILSGYFVPLIYYKLNLDVSIIKIIIDTLIFIGNYFIQKKFIFKNID